MLLSGRGGLLPMFNASSQPAPLEAPRAAVQPDLDAMLQAAADGDEAAAAWLDANVADWRTLHASNLSMPTE